MDPKLHELHQRQKAAELVEKVDRLLAHFGLQDKPADAEAAPATAEKPRAEPKHADGHKPKGS